MPIETPPVVIGLGWETGAYANLTGTLEGDRRHCRLTTIRNPRGFLRGKVPSAADVERAPCLMLRSLHLNIPVTQSTYFVITVMDFFERPSDGKEC
jgi:hypothetical protein